MNCNPITLTRHLLTSIEADAPVNDLTLIMERIDLAARRIAHVLARASLGGDLGYTGATNVQGERVKKLDEWTNEVFVETFAHGYPVCTLVSEEMADPRHFGEGCRDPSYAVLYDPIDGSSNTDVNGAVGTIFGVRRRVPGHDSSVNDLLVAGDEQVAAGYVLYGPSTMMVCTFGAGVDIFTLDPSIGEFVLWRQKIRMPPSGKTYAVNQANQRKWHPNARELIERLAHGTRSTPAHSLRYSGAFVADVHRCLLEGGIYMYPGEVSAAEGRPTGKLRLVYELAPLGFIVEQAGGRASTSRERILDVVPSKIHERQPVYIGSAAEVALVQELRPEG